MTTLTARFTPRFIGISVGLLAAAVVLSLWHGSAPARQITGPMMSECDGRIGSVVIQYVHDADAVVPVYRQFLQQLPQDVQVVVVCPDQAAFDELKSALGELGGRLRMVAVGHVMTPWSRDRWVALRPLAANDPTTLLAPRGENATAAWPERAGDQRLADDLANAGLSPRLCSQRSNLYFDGGDLLCDGQTVFVTRAVLLRNIQVTVQDRDELVRELERLTGCRVVIMPDCPDHHAGMFMMAAGDHTVVVGDPSLAKPIWDALGDAAPKLATTRGSSGPDFSQAMQAQFDSVARAAQAAGYRVVRIPTVCTPDAKTYVTYLNGLLDQRDGQRIIYLPQYSGAEPLNAAAAAVWAGLGFQVKPVDVTTVYQFHGTLHCLVNVLQKS